MMLVCLQGMPICHPSAPGLRDRRWTSHSLTHVHGSLFILQYWGENGD
jgi:hypothetical protein